MDSGRTSDNGSPFTPTAPSGGYQGLTGASLRRDRETSIVDTMSDDFAGREREYSLSSITSGSASSFYGNNVAEDEITATPFVPSIFYKCTDDSRLAPWVEKCAVIAVIRIPDIAGLAERSETDGPYDVVKVINRNLSTLFGRISRHGGEVMRVWRDKVIAVWTTLLKVDLIRAATSAIRACISCEAQFAVTTGDLHLEAIQANRRSESSTMPKSFLFEEGEALREALTMLYDTKHRAMVSTAVRELFVNNEDEPSHFTFTPASSNGGAEGEAPFFTVSSNDPIGTPSSGSTFSVGDDSLAKNILRVTDFVHPSVLRRIRSLQNLHHAADMRELDVLFFLKRGGIHVTDWFNEVYDILEPHRCSILHVVEDVAGTAIVAAMNLYAFEETSTKTLIAVLREVVSKRVACHVGVSRGSCFTGPIGFSTRLQWDIVGTAVEESRQLARLGKKEGTTVVLHKSVVKQLRDRSCVRILTSSSSEEEYFSLTMTSTPALDSVVRVTNFVPEVHRELRERLRKDIVDPPKNHAIAVIVGPALSGKKTLALSSAESKRFTPVLHTFTQSSQPLSIAFTLAHWFAIDDEDDVRSHARALIDLLNDGSVSSAYEEARSMVNIFIEKGFRIAVILDKLQFGSYDMASLRFIDDCLTAKDDGDCSGRFLWIGCFTPTRSAFLLRHLVRNVFKSDVPSFSIDHMDVEAQQALFQSFGFWSIESETAELFIEKSGGLPGQFIQLMWWFGPLLAENYVKFGESKITAKELLCTVSSSGVLQLTQRGIRTLIHTPFRTILKGYVAKFAEFADSLSPTHQIVLKTIATISHSGVACTQKLAHHVAQTFLATDFGAITDDLVSLRLLDRRDETLTFVSTVMRDAVHEMTANPHRVAVLSTVLEFLEQQNRSTDDLTIDSTEMASHDFAKAQLLHALKRPTSEVASRVTSAREWAASCTSKKLKNSISEFASFHNYGEQKAAEIPQISAPQIPVNVEQIKNFECPLALGPLSGMANRLALTIVTKYLNNAGASRTLPAFNLDLYMECVREFNRIVKSGEPEMDFQEERHELESMVSPDTDVEKATTSFLLYKRIVLDSRVKRITEEVQAAVGEELPQNRSLGLQPHLRGLLKAVDLLKDVTPQNTIVRPENGTAVNEALATLAVSNWASPYPWLCSSQLKDAWYEGWIDAVEVRSICWLFSVLPSKV